MASSEDDENSNVSLDSIVAVNSLDWSNADIVVGTDTQQHNIIFANNMHTQIEPFFYGGYPALCMQSRF
jgi:hypothetical protein